ncbi:MAG: helix-turn-helix domain-containing protein [Anaeroplasmataceae bacterium]|nr:helix-turn-helix domain-containing protein [Anaeroplasmataceae bacterium]
MHKEEAGYLFNILGNPDRVKIVKMLYHNVSLTNEQIIERMNLDFNVIEEHLKTLINANLIQNKDYCYFCNKELIDTLMSFITTRCKCC